MDGIGQYSATAIKRNTGQPSPSHLGQIVTSPQNQNQSFAPFPQQSQLHSNTMIGPSPSYVPEYDPTTGYYRASTYPPIQHNNGNNANLVPFSSSPSNSAGSFGNGSPSYAQQHFPSDQQTLSTGDYHSPTKYDGWAAANDSSYTSPPLEASVQFVGSHGTSGSFGGSDDHTSFGFGFVPQNSAQPSNGGYNVNTQGAYGHAESYSGSSIHGTPESSYFSSPPNQPAGVGYQNDLYPQSSLFGPDPVSSHQHQGYNGQPVTSYGSLYPTPVATSSNGRKIAGTARAAASAGASTNISARPVNGISAVNTQGQTYAPYNQQQRQQQSGELSNAQQQQQQQLRSNRSGTILSPTQTHSAALTALSASSYNQQQKASQQQAQSSSYTGTGNPNPKKRVRHSTVLSNIPRSQPSLSAALYDPQPQQRTTYPGDLVTTDTFEDSSDSDGESDEDVPPQPARGSASGRGRGGSAAGKAAARRKGKQTVGDSGRLPGACKSCKKLKMKCVFESDNDMVCKRCRDQSKECIVEGRKQRAPNSSKRDQLMNLVRQKDKLIDALLRQVHNPAKLQPISFVSPSPSVNSQEKVNGQPPPPPAASTPSKDIYAWLATANTGADGSKINGAARLESETFDSSDEDEAVARSGVADLEERDKGASDLGPVDSASASHGQNWYGAKKEDSPDRLEVNSSMSSGLQRGRLNSNPNSQPSSRRASAERSKLHAIPLPTAPHGLFAELSLDARTAEVRENERGRQRKLRASLSSSSLGSAADPNKAAEVAANDDEAVGPANKNYWRPGPEADLSLRRLLNERQPPEILSSGLITLTDVDNLFTIFYDRLNVFLSILDPVIHTPVDVFGRSPFLFTVVCAISSRYYTAKPTVYNIAMHFAKVAASMALTEGAKTIEICQAYILMSVYSQHARRWEEDRSWLYIRLAIAMATDLSLHVPSSTTKFLDERHEREILNRTRTWLICFNLDRSGSTQFGKPPSVQENVIVRHSADWYKRSPNNHCYDIHLVAYTALLRLVARYLEEVYSDPDSPTGLNKNIDFRGLTDRYNKELSAFQREWSERFNKEADTSDQAVRYRNNLLPFLINYSRLVMYSFGFQQTLSRGSLERGDVFFEACLESATNVLRVVIDDLAPSGYFRYAADGHFVFAAFACAFLLKLLRPQFSKVMDVEEQGRTLGYVSKIIKTLADPAVAVDEVHTPKLYSRFLEGLLQKRNQEVANEGGPPAAAAEIKKPESRRSALVTPINTAIIQESHLSNDGGLLSPTIQVEAPIGEILDVRQPPSFATAMEPLGNHLQIGNGANTYAYSTSGASTIDGLSHTATHFSNDDVLMQGDDNWIATMGAIDNPVFWNNVMTPGFAWPSPPDSGWQQLAPASVALSQRPQQQQQQQQQQPPQQYSAISYTAPSTAFSIQPGVRY
ncbi:hypothetical protein FRB94_008065 [Tulasnella sp. JGI-2019a]|nr:hypothetical protein FRB94_008065 [Tulasnella sp. JGI-2019a]KAG9027046.1 hypothetical protein FRB95_008176 [Tulasnella sp. JGI-2019a]